MHDLSRRQPLLLRITRCWPDLRPRANVFAETPCTIASRLVYASIDLGRPRTRQRHHHPRRPPHRQSPRHPRRRHSNPQSRPRRRLRRHPLPPRNLRPHPPPWLHDHAATCVNHLETQTKARTKRITDSARPDETGWTGLRNSAGADSLEVGTLRAQALASMARAKARFPGLYPRVDFEREERWQARRDAGEAVDSESDIYSDSD